LHEKFGELGLESPFDEGWRKRWEDTPPDPLTTAIDVSEYADVRREALLAHATQVDPKSPFWFGLPPEVMRTIHPYDDYRLALVVGSDGVAVDPFAATGGVPPEGAVETDLFAGIRTR
jgi:mycothiol S-conjugate amidase